MIENGYRVYDGPDGKLCFDQIVGGRIYALKPEPEDAGLQRGYYTADFTFLRDWEESAHPRGQPKNKGEFAKGGGGGGGAGGSGSGGGGGGGGGAGGVAGKKDLGETYVQAAEEEGQPQRRLSKGGESYVHAEEEEQQPAKSPHGGLVEKHKAGASHNPLREFGKSDYRIIHRQIQAIKPESRHRLSANLQAVAKSIPKLVVSHIREQKEDFIGAAGAIRALATGKRPDEAQWHGLKATGRTILLAGIVMATTGGAGHALHPVMAAAGEITGHAMVEAGSALAQEFGSEMVQHVILEHAAAIVSGAGRYAKHAIGGDAAMGDEDMAMLQRYAQAIAESVDTLGSLDEDDVRAALAGGEANGEADGEANGNDAEDVDYPQTEDIAWADAPWEEAKHKRGQPKNRGQFGPGGGGGGGKAAGGIKSPPSAENKPPAPSEKPPAPENGQKQGPDKLSAGPDKLSAGPDKPQINAIQQPAGAKVGPGGAPPSAGASAPATKGKGDSGPAASLLPDPPPDLPPEQMRAWGDSIAARVPGAPEAVAHARDMLASMGKWTSKGEFFDKATNAWKPERAAVHQQILSELFTREAIDRATPAPGEKKTMIVLGGRGGSGKSFFTKEGSGPIDEKKFLVIDSDKFKEALPEYKGWNAALLHDECDTLVELAQQRAQKYGLNVLHDATIKNEEGVANRVADYKDKGYRIEGHYMFCPPEEAAKRATERFVGGSKKAAASGKEGAMGRFVPPEVVLGNRKNERNFDKLSKAFDDWSLFDNSVEGGVPKFVANKKGDKVAPGTSPQAGSGKAGPPGQTGSGKEGKAADRRYAIGDWVVRITTRRRGHDQRVSG